MQAIEKAASLHWITSAGRVPLPQGQDPLYAFKASSAVSPVSIGALVQLHTLMEHRATRGHDFTSIIDHGLGPVNA